MEAGAAISFHDRGDEERGRSDVMSQKFSFFGGGGEEKKSASSPLLHVTCMPRGTFFKVGVGGGVLKYLRSDRAKQVER